MKQTPVAFLLAPLIPAVVFAHDAGPVSSVALSYFWSFVIGLPVFLILRRIKREYHLCYAVVGFSLGFLAFFAQGDMGSKDTLLAGFLFGLIGFAVSISFSLIRGRERKLADPVGTDSIY